MKTAQRIGRQKAALRRERELIRQRWLGLVELDAEPDRPLTEREKAVYSLRDGVSKLARSAHQVQVALATLAALDAFEGVKQKPPSPAPLKGNVRSVQFGSRVIAGKRA